MIRWVLVALTVLTLSACTTMRLGYNSANTLIAYRMNDWFDMSGELEAPARERLDTVLTWHRRDELPEYSRLLLSARERFADPAPFTPDQVLAMQKQVTQRLLRTGDKTADAFADLFPRFGLAQRKRLIARMDESNAEFSDKNIDISPQKLRKRRIDDMEDRFAFWFGKLDSAQRNRIEKWADEAEPSGTERLAVRRMRQTAFLNIVDAGKTVPVPEINRKLKGFFADLENPVDTGVRDRQRKQLQAWASLTADLINSASPAQRTRIQEKIKTMSDDFLTLSRQK
jgi:hypothetical protein